MDRKIIEPLVLGPARTNRLQKPVLVIGTFVPLLCLWEGPG